MTCYLFYNGRVARGPDPTKKITHEIPGNLSSNQGASLTPFPNARSACTCGGPAQRCCLLNATETEDPLLIHSMKLPFLVHNVLIETSSSTSPRGSNGEITDSNSPPNGTSGTIGLQGIDVPAQGLASAAHVGQRVTRWNSSISLPPNGQTRCTAPSSTSCSAATIADIEIGTVLRHTHRRLPRQGGARTSIASLFCFEMCGILVD